MTSRSATRQAASETLTEALAGQQINLVVWGESSVGVDLASHPDTVARLVELRRQVGADLLVNVDARAADGGIYKSSVLIGPAGVRGSYAKTRLVPFGEYVPLRSLLGWATRNTKAAGEDRRRGDGPVVLHTESLTVGPLISFETTFSDLPRRLVRLGADLLAYQSSTSSYQGSWAQPQLASMAAVHAVEVGHPAVHAGLSGVSSAFDARGRKLGWLPDADRGVLVVDVPLDSRTTFYNRLGDWPIVLALLTLRCGVRESAANGFEGVADPACSCDRTDAEPANGLGFPAAGSVPDPRQLNQVGVTVEDEIGKSAAGGVGRGDSLTGVATRPCESCSAVEADSWQEISRHAEHAAPGVRDTDALQRREQALERVAQPFHDTRIRPRRRRDAATPAGRCSPGRPRRCAHRRSGGRNRATLC